MAVLHAEPLGWASSGMSILSGAEEITQLKITAFRRNGSFTLDGEEFSIEAKGFFQADAVLRKGTSVIAKVRSTSFFRRRFEISSAGHRLVLESRGWRGREYGLLLGTQEVGRVKREGFAGKTFLMEFPDDMPVFLQVLLVYVLASQVKRERAAAGA